MNSTTPIGRTNIIAGSFSPYTPPAGASGLHAIQNLTSPEPLPPSNLVSATQRTGHFQEGCPTPWLITVKPPVSSLQEDAASPRNRAASEAEAEAGTGHGPGLSSDGLFLTQVKVDYLLPAQ